MITSKQNALIKEIRSLTDKKNRDELNLFVVEGSKLVKEALASDYSIKAIVGTEQGLALVGDFLGNRIEQVSQEVFDYISTEKSPQGVLSIVYKKENSPIKDGRCLFLDGVSDPSNVGAIIRTAAASGYNCIYSCNSADPYNSKALRASMGGIFKVNFINVIREDFIQSTNMPILVADMQGVNAFDFEIDGDFCLVIGNEANGVSSFVKSKATHTISIPMQNGMESLNASVSAGILMYSLANRRK